MPAPVKLNTANASNTGVRPKVGQPQALQIPNGNGNNGKSSPAKKRADKYLDLIFKCLVIPASFVSAFSSISTFLLTNFFNKENEYLDKIAEHSNKLSYFLSGIYGGLENSYHNNTPGTLGYGFVSLSSIFGTKENMYMLKGPGSAFDQLPAMLEDVAYNPEIIKKYKLEKDKEKDFNKYPTFRDSFGKLLFATQVVCKDIVRELKENMPKGFFTALKKVFIKGERVAEKHLTVTSLGILSGVFLALVPGLYKIGRSIRDISGAYADAALFAKGFSKAEDGKATGVGNMKYMLCGALYMLGSFSDFIYNWTGLNKLELAAVGFDNAGMLFMTWANATDNKASRNTGTQNVVIPSSQISTKASDLKPQHALAA